MTEREPDDRRRKRELLLGRVRTAIERTRAVRAPDDRVAVFDPVATVEDGRVVLSGVVPDDATRRDLERSVSRACAGVGIEVESEVGDGIRSRLRTVSAVAEPRTAATVAAPVRSTPDPDGEQVTQATYGTTVTAMDRRRGWRRVRTADGYVGWVRGDALVPPASTVADRTDGRAAAVVTNRVADPRWIGEGERCEGVRSEREGPTECGVDATLPDRIPRGTPCRIGRRAGNDDRGPDDDRGSEDERDPDDERRVGDEHPSEGGVLVRFATGAAAELPDSSVTALVDAQSDPAAAGRAVAEIAREFLGTPYEWGGMTGSGIDCSGLTLVSYACLGVDLPRDTDQQERVGVDVDRDALRAGDLLFFPGHVAVATDGSTYVHAHGDTGAVTTNSLDPADERYHADLDDAISSLKRPLGR
ncbi:SH3 domain-containing protein [Halorubrum sp. JWXQ-INN 858]|uniref:NlpC/P60 family protein n=1 Tax=Halorubrum sp. JWXQ-INN 858 TaxID=2690782 RepID=UPI0013592A35|nr:NlpC/P60 family protein [Halorubrum sp. JWXQ-INN 858]MWV64935.1 SH3 domain-containing protein [Halorubrum sp. JWXQ-INN 858]